MVLPGRMSFEGILSRQNEVNQGPGCEWHTWERKSSDLGVATALCLLHVGPQAVYLTL